MENRTMCSEERLCGCVIHKLLNSKGERIINPTAEDYDNRKNKKETVINPAMKNCARTLKGMTGYKYCLLTRKQVFLIKES